MEGVRLRPRPRRNEVGPTNEGRCRQHTHTRICTHERANGQTTKECRMTLTRRCAPYSPYSPYPPRSISTALLIVIMLRLDLPSILVRSCSCSCVRSFIHSSRYGKRWSNQFIVDLPNSVVVGRFPTVLGSRATANCARVSTAPTRSRTFGPRTALLPLQQQRRTHQHIQLASRQTTGTHLLPNVSALLCFLSLNSSLSIPSPPRPC